MSPDPAERAGVFRYRSWTIDAANSRIIGEYELDRWHFREEFGFTPSGAWDSPAVRHAARLLYLMAGVSYYKAGAPPVIDLGDTPISDREREFLTEYYLQGLGEFAYRAGLSLDGLQLVGGRDFPQPAAGKPLGHGPLIPFGGGLDSIVTVELLRATGRLDGARLFVVNKAADRFDAIERPAALTGLPISRATRSLDPQILRSAELGFFNGHVPVTGIISAMACVTAALEGLDAVVMSNEWSSSSATLVTDDGRSVNHQYSKSADFENGFRTVMSACPAAPDYFSLLRPWTELWIARYFADHASGYLLDFRSCNRAFHINPEHRSATWCGRCDKCAFIDLMLAPFVPADRLSQVFSGAEPLMNPSLQHQFDTLLGLVPGAKPWECVGDVAESRVAARMAARLPKRADSLLPGLAAAADQFSDPSVEALMSPMSGHHIPDRYVSPDLG